MQHPKRSKKGDVVGRSYLPIVFSTSQLMVSILGRGEVAKQKRLEAT